MMSHRYMVFVCLVFFAMGTSQFFAAERRINFDDSKLVDRLGGKEQINTKGKFEKHMVRIENGNLVLAARHEPYGEITETYVDLASELGNVKNEWTCETRVVYDGHFLDEQAGLYAGDKDYRFLLTVGRLRAMRGQPIDAQLSWPDGAFRITLNGMDKGDAVYLRMAFCDGKIYGFYSLDGKQWVLIGIQTVPETFKSECLGATFIDSRAPLRAKRVQAGILPDSEARFEYLSFSNCMDKSIKEMVPSVFLRIRLHDIVGKKDVPVLFKLENRTLIHEKGFSLALGANGEILPCGSSKRLSSLLNKDQGLCKGQQTAWLNLSEQFASPALQMTLALFMYQDDKPVEAYDVSVDFATAPSDDAIIKSVRHDSRLPKNHPFAGNYYLALAKKEYGNTLGIYLPEAAGPLKRWGPKILTLAEYNRARYEAAVAGGAKPFKLARRIPICVSGHMIFMDPATVIEELRVRGLLGENRPLTNLRWYGSKRPPLAGPERAEFMKDIIQKSYDYSVKKYGPAYCKYADEAQVLKPEVINENKAALTEFHNQLIQCGYTPADFGYSSWNEVHVIDKSQVSSQADARLYVESSYFRQWLTGNLCAAFTEEIKNIYGTSVITGQSAHWTSFLETLDYFIEARTGASGVQMHHFGSGDTLGPRQVHAAFFIADALRSAAKNTKITPGMLYYLCRIQQEEGGVLAGMTGLIRGLYGIYYYGYGPFYTGWEWFSDDRYAVGGFVAGSRISRIASQYEDYLIDCQSPQAQVGMVLSRSSDLWQGDTVSIDDVFGYDEVRNRREKDAQTSKNDDYATGFDVERRMLHAALQWKNYTTDIIPEERLRVDMLKSYRAIYVYEPNLSRIAQEALMDWVHSGGVLYLGPQAAIRDELNRKHDILFSATANPSVSIVSAQPGGTFIQYGSFGEVYRTLSVYDEEDVKDLKILGHVSCSLPQGSEEFTFDAVGVREKLSDKGGRVIARFEDNSPAVVIYPVGKGFIVKSATALGAAWARTANPGFNAKRSDAKVPPFSFQNSGITAYYRRTLDKGLHDLLTLPVVLGDVSRPVKVSAPFVDVGLFEKGDGSGAILLLGNYNKDNHKNLNITVSPKFPYLHAKSFSGVNVEYSFDGNTASLRLPLKDIEVVELQP